jgi:beta-mannosidase
MAQQVKHLTENWQVARYTAPDEEPVEPDKPPSLEGLHWIDAGIPGAVHYDLVASSELVNPLSSSQAARDAAWVAESDWICRTRFTLEGIDLPRSRFVLTFEGIDTFSDVWLNGSLVGRTRNALRTHRYLLNSSSFHDGENELLVHLKAHARMIQPQIAEADRMDRHGEPSGVLGKSLIRRYQRSFHTEASLLNLGAGVLGIGINKPVTLAVYTGPFIAGFLFQVTSVARAEVRTSVIVEIDSGSNQADLAVSAVLWESDPNRPVAMTTTVVEAGAESARFSLSVGEPKLWWPAGYGEPFLYNLTLRLSRGDQVLHELERRVGLKQIELVTQRPNGSTCFMFRVNGSLIYARGFTFVPVDCIKVHGSDSDYDNLFTLMRNAHANMLRVWGGGAVERERFYDLCDQYGILLWHDFFLHSNVYPDYDSEFVEEFRQEAISLAKAVRNHVSLAILCGGNEQLEGWDEWNWSADMERLYGEKLLTEVLPSVVATLCPGVPYVPNSPHGGKWAQSPVTGDTHTWGDLHNATKDPQFVTETCWTHQSYSRPETLRTSMDLDVDRFSSDGWQKTWSRLTGLPLLTNMPYSSLYDRGSLRSYLRSLEIEQAQADYHALSLLRLRSSSCSGILYWSLNKGSPLFQFGCVDYGGYPMMSYYVVKRAFADVVIGVYRDIDDIRVVASSTYADPIDALLELRHFGTDGAILGKWSAPVRIRPRGSTRLFDLGGYYSSVADRTREMIHAQLIVNEVVVASDSLFFCPFSEFVVKPSSLSARAISASAEGCELEISVDSVAKLIEIEADHRLMLSDNYFAHVPGRPKLVRAATLDGYGGPLTITVSSADNPNNECVTIE